MIAYRPPARRRWSPRRSISGNPIKEFQARLPELKEAGNFFLVTGGFWVGDLILHEMIPVTEGPKTGPYYYGNKLIWTPVGLAVGRLISDYIVKGSNFVRALTIGTFTNLLLQVRYLGSYAPDFNIAVFLIHEALLVPLSFLITGPSPATGFYGSEAKA